jgi:NADH-quinone oxidoreductase subunit N
MYFKEPAANAAVPQVSGGFKLTLVVIAGIIILLGIFPDLLLQYLYF